MQRSPCAPRAPRHEWRAACLRAQALRRWAALPQPPADEELRAFVAATFGAPGDELEAWTPPDHSAAPPLVLHLTGEAARFASHLNGLWPMLGRRVVAEFAASPRRSTLLAPSGGFIVPGGRFREAYYWDSYWVVLGLLAVDMRDTAAAVCDALLDLVADHGFVPNGMRSYYLNRSQPPMLTQMVVAILEAGPPARTVGSEAAGSEAEAASQLV